MQEVSGSIQSTYTNQRLTSRYCLKLALAIRLALGYPGRKKDPMTPNSGEESRACPGDLRPRARGSRSQACENSLPVVWSFLLRMPRKEVVCFGRRIVA
jgi:hypothetical protein